MRRTLLFLTITACWTALCLAQQPMPIQRISLYKNGMAYIVRGGEISQPIRLAFHPDEMNDILKTFSAWNPQSGQLYSLGYTTGIPTGQLLGRYPFDLRDPEAGMATFLTQVKGAPISLEVAGRTLQGKLMAVSPGKRSAGPDALVDDHRISVLQDSGSVQTVWLSQLRWLRMEDAPLQNQLRSYLEILAEGSQDVTREISIYPAEQPGPIRAAYLQQFPVWKTTYRLQFDGREANIEGWALIDNPTGESWEGVELTLISGMPVSFVMDLYQPLYASRTEVPVPGARVAAPRSYETAVRTRQAQEEAKPPPARARRESRIQDLALSRRPATALMKLSVGAMPAEAPPVDFQQAQATQIQDYFEYRFPFPVRLAGRQSAFLPFIRKPIQAERVSIFNARQDRIHPLNGARLHNNSGVPLEAGPVTVFEQGRYAGEAVLEYMPRDDRRFISYGVDYEIVVSLDQSLGAETVTGVKIQRGVATIQRERTETRKYLMRNKASRAKTLWIEHPRQKGRELKGGQPEEMTESFYRFRTTLEVGEEKELPVSEILSRRTALRIADADKDRIEVFFSGWRIPAALQAKLDAIIDIRQRRSEGRGRLSDLEGEIASISKDQERLRENLKALGSSREESPLRNRYVQKLAGQEDRLDQLREEVARVRGEVRALQSELAQKVAALEWE
ncbi:MAG: hypothetical protein V3T83_04915 [Acidobacteriota bacterium]